MIKLEHKTKKELEKLGVAAVYLFGSHAEGVASALSDLDIAILLKDADLIANDSFGIYEKLYDLFIKEIPGFANKIDIVFLDRSPLELAHDVVTHGKVLFDADVQKRVSYQERILLKYADFFPILKQFDEAILLRF
ncbi:MAG: nucleotidyltransferase domain-containing protein [Candidatus Portnoybacteria bacterium]|nr:nucleotidyltransferase domain-containing protein [Candidatus Portnoybacteria bacterium]